MLYVSFIKSKNSLLSDPNGIAQSNAKALGEKLYKLTASVPILIYLCTNVLCMNVTCVEINVFKLM